MSTVAKCLRVQVNRPDFPERRRMPSMNHKQAIVLKTFSLKMVLIDASTN